MIRRLLVLSLVLGGLLGCETDDLVSPGDYGGWIEGEVTDGDPDLAGQMVEFNHIAWDGTVTRYQTYTDDVGYYRIGVPNGRVVISASGATTLYFRHDGITTNRSEADTVLVDGLALRADFRCARLEVVVADGLEHPETWHHLVVREPDLGWGRYIDSERLRHDGDALRAYFRLLPPGAYWMTARGVFGEFYLPGSCLPAEAASVQVAAGSLTSYSVETPTPAMMSGTVLGSWQALGLEPPVIYAESQDGLGAFEGSCDEQGQFTVSAPVGGDFRLRIRITDQDGTWRSFDRWVGGSDRESAQVFSLEGGQAIGGIDVLEGGLEIVLPDDPVRTRTKIAIDDEQGAQMCCLWYDDPEPIRVAGLEAGRYRVFVETDGLSLPAYHDGAASFEEAEAVEVLDGGVTLVPVVLVEGGRIEGRLEVSGAGAPTEPFALELVTAENWFDTVYQYTSDNDLPRGFDYDPASGDFRLSLLPDGVYCLRILYGTVGWSWYPGVTDRDQATRLVIEDGGEVTGIVWQL